MSSLADGMILDIGGEGRHPLAWNINISPVKTVGPERGRPIPRLILGRAEALPIGSHVAESVIVERTPLVRRTIEELLRVVRPSGTIILRHVPVPNLDRHALAKEMIRGDWHVSAQLIGNQQIQETRFRLPHRFSCPTAS